MIAVLRTAAKVLTASAAGLLLVATSAAHGQQIDDGWHPARKPLASSPAYASPAEAGPLLAARPRPAAQWQRGPIDSAPPVQPMARARTLPFAEDEIIVGPQPDVISTPQAGAAVMPPQTTVSPDQAPYLGNGQVQFDPNYDGQYFDPGNGEYVVGDPEMVDGPVGPYYGGPYWRPWLQRPWFPGLWSVSPPNAGYMGFEPLGHDVMANERFHPCSPWSLLNELSVFAGTQAFKGPVDQGMNGNFGFHEGVNAADSIWHRKGLGYQIGVNFVQSNFHGSQVGGVQQTLVRDQVFVTAGLFHRAFYGRGVQGGVVYDYMSDNYYVSTSLGQLRGELSVVAANGHEFGYWGVAGTQTSIVPFNGAIVGPQNQRIKPIDMNTLFYRKTMPHGGQARIWGGMTGAMYGNSTTARNAGMFGADFRVALSNQLDFLGGFNYIASSHGDTANSSEAWGLSMSVAFYPGRYLKGRHNGPYRALFDVANNNTFILDRQPQ
ncbi:MAG TPA: DUF6666 family protein [Pirellulales bacterium]|nr:DUF6666 family protein [Pirellulales bacterium]